VALRINSAGGKRLKAGDTVPYVICEDGSGLAATQRAYHLDEVRDSATLRVDTHYYLAQQLHPVVARLCDPVEGMDSARIAACLGKCKSWQVMMPGKSFFFKLKIVFLS
jgi:DNA polymerase alpha subunit A